MTRRAMSCCGDDSLRCVRCDERTSEVYCPRHRPLSAAERLDLLREEIAWDAARDDLAELLNPDGVA